MSQSVHNFGIWLSTTRASLTIQAVPWIIPTVQTIHILSIGIVMASALLIDLRVFGLIFREQSLQAVSRRFLPWIWCTLIVLLVSGSTLIVGEPSRSLQNPAFIAKMLMLFSTICLTLGFQRGLVRDPGFWEASVGRRSAVRTLASCSWLLWVGIVLAGRWIAYINLPM